MKSRREFLKLSACAVVGIAGAGLSFAEQKINLSTNKKNMKFPLVALEYAYDALEPSIDAKTVEIHHDKHQATYVAKLNDAISSDPSFSYNGSLTMLLSDLGKVPEKIRTAVRNNGGGAWNHEFYWKGLGPSAAKAPSGALGDAIKKSFGDFENFKKQLSAAAVNCFGSGWAWLGVDKEGNLKICSTPNQDSPIMGSEIAKCDMIPIFNIDVWEHAYYLKYQNLRAAYVDAIWNVINWDKLKARFEKALKDGKVML